MVIETGILNDDSVTIRSENYNNSRTPREPRDTRSCVCVTSAVHTFRYWIQIVVSLITLVERYVESVFVQIDGIKHGRCTLAITNSGTC